MTAKKPPGSDPVVRRRHKTSGATTGGTTPSALTAPLGPPLPPPHPAHRGEPVRVGPYTVLAGGTRDLREEDLERADVLVPLNGEAPFALGRAYRVIGCPMRDFGGAPSNWREFLERVIVPELAAGSRLLAFCVGSHGRTGTFLASLIALLESVEETPDPIEAARKRHCERAVETRAQAEAVFALRGEPLPSQYEKEFAPRVPLGLGGVDAELLGFYRGLR